MEQILEGENGHQASSDQPLPYGAVTCSFSANWERTTAYGTGSPLPEC